MGCFDITPGTPKPSTVSNEYLNLVGGFEKGMPTLANTEKTYKPGFIDTALGGINQSLNSPNGLLSTYLNLVPGMTGANTTARTADVNDVGALGAQAASAIRGVNPQGTGLLDTLNEQANLGLGAGSQLLPGEVSRISSGVRGDWASRGLGTSAPAQLDEAMQLYGAGDTARQSRQNFALGVNDANLRGVTAPALSLVTGQNPTTGAATDFLNAASTLAGAAGPSLIPGSQNYDIFNTAYNARAAADIASANNRAAVMGGAMSY